MENENLLASNVDYLKDALAVLEELNKAKAQRNQLQISIKEIELDISGEEKASQDEIELTIKKRKEEIAASFDREIRKDQDRIRKIRSDRERAKSKGIVGRIEEETKDVREENRQINQEIMAILKENRLPKYCNTKFYYAMFYPRGIIEYLIFTLTAGMLLFLLPYGIFWGLPAQKPVWLLLISFCCFLVFFVVHQLIAQRTKTASWPEIRQIRGLRDKIKANHKKIRAIKNAIQKDRNEEHYNLESFDISIKEVEDEVKNTMAEKQEALTTFEETTKNMLIEEIRSRYQVKLEALKMDKEEADTKLKEADSLVKDINKHITANYEAFLGKDYVNEEALQDMIGIMEEEGASTVAEALALYKSER